MKILTIIGARPQIIKAAAISRAIKENFSSELEEIIVHTGQHYDDNMSEIFIRELGIPEPNFNLNVGSGSHGQQTAKMLSGIETIILSEKPDAVVVYGDTNSTVAGGLAASKLHVPLVHIEAGLRSFNKKMPEEVNRVLCDHMSTLLFSPTKQGIDNLVREGFYSDNAGPYSADNPGIYHCGDIMYDNSLHFSKISDERSTILEDIGVDGDFILATVHRDSNTDYPARLKAIFNSLTEICQKDGIPLVLPLHPRTRKKLDEFLPEKLQNGKEEAGLKIIPPASFLDMIALEKNAKLIVTDSGGVQKESFFFKKPCLILRPETEWVEIVENGNAIICDADQEKILKAYDHFSTENNLTYPPFYGDGQAGKFICSEILKQLG